MSRMTKIALLAAIVAVFVLLNVNTTMAVNGQGKAMTMVLEGNYRVHYNCAFMDKTKKSDQEEQVHRIEFHPEYIVLIGQTGSGRVIPVHAIKELTWEPS